MSMLSAAQVAELLGLSARSVYDIPESRLPRYRVGAQGGAIRYELADVEAYKASCRCTGLLAVEAERHARRAMPSAILRAVVSRPATAPAPKSKARKAAPYSRPRLVHAWPSPQ